MSHELEVLANAEIGKVIGLMWEARSTWIHRRVDTYEFRDAATISCHASLDITMPEETPVIVSGADRLKSRIIPLMLVKKRSLTSGFNLCDEGGNSLPRLGAPESCLIGGRVIEYVTQEVASNHATPPPGIDISEGSAAIASLEWRGGATGAKDSDFSRWTIAQSTTDESRRAFEIWISRMADYYFMCALVPEHYERSLILKVCYDVEFKWQSPWPAKLGWDSQYFSIRASASDCTSYHCEISVPEGIDVADLKFVADPEFSETAEIPQANKVPGSRCALLGAQHCPEGRDYAVWLYLRATRRGWLTAAAFSGIAMVCLLAFSAIYTPRLATLKTDSTKPATDVFFLMATLYLSVGAAIIAILARTSEHQLTSHMLKWLRYVMATLTALAFGAVLVLIPVRNPDALQWFFIAFALLAAPLSGCLVSAWCRSRNQTQP